MDDLAADDVETPAENHRDRKPKNGCNPNVAERQRGNFPGIKCKISHLQEYPGTEEIQSRNPKYSATTHFYQQT
jgi:hypothetical protein